MDLYVIYSGLPKSLHSNGLSIPLNYLCFGGFMLRWLWRIIVGVKHPISNCEHQWDELERRDMYVIDPFTGQAPNLPSYTKYILKCEKCGWIEKRNL